jgi:DNA topoisomerase VI subunit A
MMGIDELERFRDNCKKLTESDRKRLNLMLENTDFNEFKETITYMLNNNIKLEQEAEN